MNSSSNLINALFIFVLAGFIGFEVIRRVSPLLHTPLMSLTNALDAIAVVGAILLVGEHQSTLSTVFGFVAVVAATSNIYSGLWYPIAVAAMSFVVALIFLPETKDRDITRI